MVFLKNYQELKSLHKMHTQLKMTFGKYLHILGEKGRMQTAYKNAGLRLGQEFIDPKGVTEYLMIRYLKEASAELVRNNIPNYAMYQNLLKV